MRKLLFSFLLITQIAFGQFLINPYAFAVADTTPLLDTYPADVAFSLRKLRTAYSGNCIEVRRSSDNTTQDIGFVNNILDTAALMAFTGTSSAFVRTWYNQGDSVFNVTQTTNANQPRIVNAGALETKNGKPAIRFLSASNTRLINAGHPVCIQDGNANSAFAVGSHETSGGLARVFSARQSGVGTWAILIDRRTDKRLGFIFSNSTNYLVDMPSQINNSDLRLLTMLVNSSKAMAGFVNSTTGTTNTYVSPYTLIDTWLGGFQEGGQYLNGHISEFIIMPTDEAANRTAIETNINAFYSIY